MFNIDWKFDLLSFIDQQCPLLPTIFKGTSVWTLLIKGLHWPSMATRRIYFVNSLSYFNKGWFHVSITWNYRSLEIKGLSVIRYHTLRKSRKGYQWMTFYSPQLWYICEAKDARYSTSELDLDWMTSSDCHCTTMILTNARQLNSC